jgi:hypothetical protein
MSRAPRQHEPFVPDGGEPLLAAGAFNRRYEQPEVMEHRLLLAAGRRAADEDRFARLKTLQAGGESRAAIVREIGLNWRTSPNGYGWTLCLSVGRWRRRQPHQNIFVLT